MVIDFHTHIFPDKIARMAINKLEENIKQASKVEVKACHDGNLAGLLKSMEKNDITYSVVMPIATNPRQTESINTFAKLINNKNGVYSFGSIHPEDEEWEKHLEEIKEMGLLGIKLHPEYQDFYVDSAKSIEILKRAKDLGLYVMLHTGKDAGVDSPVHCTPEMLANAVEKADATNVIAAHFGGFGMWERSLEYLLELPIYIDTSMSFGIASCDTLLGIIENHDNDKILFGSDCPWQDQGFAKRYLNELNLSEELKEKILYQNGAKLLDIKI